MLERRINDYWNIEGNRNLSDTWMGFTRFTILDEKPPDGFSWSGWRLTKKQTTPRTHYLWPEIWKDMSEAAQRKEKQKWAIEIPRLDNARKLRGIHFIDPADEEFEETIKNAPRKLEVPMPVAMPCKTRGREYRETCSAPGICKIKCACIVEADESTRKGLEGTLHQDREDHIAGKGINSLNHCNLVHKSIPMSQATKIPDAKTVIKEW